MSQPSSRTLFSAATSGNLKKLELCKESGLDLNARNSEGRSPLELACQKGRENAVAWFIEQRVALKGGIQAALLSFVCPLASKVSILDLLLQAGQKPTELDLYEACRLARNSLEALLLVEKLLDAGAGTGSLIAGLRADLEAEVDSCLLSEREKEATKALLEILPRVTESPVMEETSLGSGETIEKPDWENLRGVRVFANEEAIVLVKRPARETAELVARWSEDLKALPLDAHGIEVVPPTYLVYQIEGHEWSVVDGLTGPPPMGSRGLAEQMTNQSSVFEYSYSDTSEEASLTEYSHGQLVQQIARKGPHRVRGNWRQAMSKRLESVGALAPGLQFRVPPGARLETLPIDCRFEAWVVRPS
jgi:hypothetical protein